MYLVFPSSPANNVICNHNCTNGNYRPSLNAYWRVEEAVREREGESDPPYFTPAVV